MSRSGVDAFVDWKLAVSYLEAAGSAGAGHHAWTALLSKDTELLGFVLVLWPASGVFREATMQNLPNNSIGKSSTTARLGVGSILQEVGLLETFASTVTGVLQRRRREQATTSLRLQRRFLATMSHELRTPLNAVRPESRTTYPVSRVTYPDPVRSRPAYLAQL